MTEQGLYPNEKFVLLVEDNEDDAELTLRAFERNKVINKVIHVRDGVEALDFLFGRAQFSEREVTHLPAVVLLDISMPRLNGLDVLEAMRADARTRDVPVVMLTTSDEQVDISRAYSGGANSYVRKPVEFGDFIGAVGQLGVYWMMLNLPNELVTQGEVGN